MLRLRAGKDDEVLEKGMLAIRGDAQRCRRAVAECGAGAQRMSIASQLEPPLAAGDELNTEPVEGAAYEVVVGATVLPPGTHDLERSR